MGRDNITDWEEVPIDDWKDVETTNQPIPITTPPSGSKIDTGMNNLMESVGSGMFTVIPAGMEAGAEMLGFEGAIPGKQGYTGAKEQFIAQEAQKQAAREAESPGVTTGGRIIEGALLPQGKALTAPTFIGKAATLGKTALTGAAENAGLAAARDENVVEAAAYGAGGTLIAPAAGLGLRAAGQAGRTLPRLIGMTDQDIDIAVNRGKELTKEVVGNAVNTLSNAYKGLKESLGKYKSIRPEKIPLAKREELTGRIRDTWTELQSSGKAVNTRKNEVLAEMDAAKEQYSIAELKASLDEAVRKNLPENLVTKIDAEMAKGGLGSDLLVQQYLNDKLSGLGNKKQLVSAWTNVRNYGDNVSASDLDAIRKTLWEIRDSTGSITTKELKPIMEGYNYIKQQMYSSKIASDNGLDELFEASMKNAKAQNELAFTFKRANRDPTKVGYNDISGLVDINANVRRESLSKAIPEIGGEVEDIARRYSGDFDKFNQQKAMAAATPDLGYTDKGAQTFIRKASDPKKNVYQANKIAQFSPEVRDQIKLAAAKMSMDEGQYGNIISRVLNATGLPVAKLLLVPTKILEATISNPALISAIERGGPLAAVSTYNTLMNKDEKFRKRQMDKKEKGED